MARSVCWRGMAVRLPPVSKPEPVVKRSAISVTESRRKARRRQLQRERNAVELPADATPRRRRNCTGGLEVGHLLAGAIEEQLSSL